MYSANTNEFDTLALSGSGIRAIAQLGALQYYIDRQILNLDKISDFYGTSAGSILSLLIAIGYNPTELLQELCKDASLVEFDKLAAQGTDLLKSAYTNCGLLDFDIIQDKIAVLMEKKGVKRDITFAEMLSRGKNLVVVATEMGVIEARYFSAKEDPKMPCLLAVRFSCCIPLIFQRNLYEGKYYVDGAFSDNFPLAKAKAEHFGSGRILGIGVTSSMLGKDEDLTTPLAYFYRLAILSIAPIYRLQRQVIDACLAPYITALELQVDAVFILDLGLSDSKKVDIFISGYTQARDHDKVKP
jgi:predicted acylesterase/phospholipase RssA